MKSLLLDPQNNDAAGGGDIQAHVPIQGNPGAEVFKGSPSIPVQNTPNVPENVKGTTFDIEGEDFNLKDDAKEDLNVSKEFRKVDEKRVEKIESKKTLIDKIDESNKLASKEQLESLVKEKDTGDKKTTRQPLPARDFSPFPDEVKEILKDTSRPSFDYITKVFKENAEIKAQKESLEAESKQIKENGVPATWYEHPEAWRLHPDAQYSTNRLSKLEAEENFWREQLTNITGGERYRMLQGWNQNGQLVVGDEIEPTEQARTDIFLKLGRYQSEKQNEAVRLNNFAQSFQGKMNGFNTEAQKIIDTEWPWHKDEKAEGQKWVNEFKGVVPKELQSQLGFKVAGLLYASYKKSQEMLAEAVQGAKTEEIKGASTRLAEPSLRSPSVSGANKAATNRNGTNGAYSPPEEFNLEGMM